MDRISGHNSDHYLMSLRDQPRGRASEQSTPIWERSTRRGMHSSVGKAIEAHRERAEERMSRSFNRGSNNRLENIDTAFNKSGRSEFANYTPDAVAVAPREAMPNSSMQGAESFQETLSEIPMSSSFAEPMSSLAKQSAVESFTNSPMETIRMSPSPQLSKGTLFNKVA